MKVYLGYDTSCYTTSIAAVSEEGKVLANSRRLLSVKNGEKGLRQSEGVFQHLKQINEVFENLIEELKSYNYTISAVSASVSPRNLDGSYMPVFLVGTQFAKHLSWSLNVPFIECNHQLGHIYAAKYQSTCTKNKFLCFHLSGGTTELLLYNEGQIDIIGKTSDISIGQFVDRIGVSMGLNFPAGRYLEKLALQSNGSCFRIPSSVDLENLTCSFSGAESFVMNNFQKFSKEDIAYAIYCCVCNTIIKLLKKARDTTQVNDVLFFGGVASSLLLRKLVREQMEKNRLNIVPHFGFPEYSSDNAVGVSLYCREMANNKQK